MKFNFYLTLLSLFFPIFTFGQVNGVVLDGDNEPAIGAYIFNSKTEKHCHTNESGYFVLNNPMLGDTFEVSYLGHERVQFVLEDLSEEITIRLTATPFDLSEVVVGQNIKRLNLLSDIDTKVKPVKSSQELLTIVPGLFIGQHAGGGKAEQIFLRGFDIDHGTDLSMTVDGIPVNMVSHAHGQGYSDLHFVIPETVDFIDFGKGPYYANKGNFTTAGYVGISTKKKLEHSSVKFEVGSFNTLRSVGLFDIINKEKVNLYLASEYQLTDGPFESSQNFSRRNLMLKFNAEISKRDQITFTASNFRSQWDASGQIPTRAVESGLINRFGAIDDTEGGNTGRTNLGLQFNRTLNNHTFVKNSVFYSLYDFELFSNFTFFLNDEENGDQIRQFEKRQLYGAQTEWNYSSMVGNNLSTFVQTGVGFRQDDVRDNTLARTLNRRTTLNNRLF